MSLINFRSVFQYLYVLYLDIVGGTIPDAIGSLYHLKLLSLSRIHNLPSSIGNLKNLQTLVVVGGALTFQLQTLVVVGGALTFQLPRQTADLINLRHLVVWCIKPLLHINKLTNLQVLKGIKCNQRKYIDPVDLVNLRELSMSNIRKSYSLNNFSSLKNLGTLELFCRFDESFPSIEFVIHCEKLEKLYLYGSIEKLPNPFSNSITMMTLAKSKLTEDPMPILGMLPNLRNLQLKEAYFGKEIICSDNSFCQLEFLHLERLRNLETWHSGTNAMPLIKGLCIDDCPNLKEIPERMKCVELVII